MGLLGWLSGEPRRSDLEKFCARLTLEGAARLFDSDIISPKGLMEAYGFTLLYMAREFVDGARKDRLLGQPGQTRPNVAIFEAAVFLWCVSQVPIMRRARDELGLDDEGDICGAVSAARSVMLGVIEHHWPGSDVENAARSRVYVGRADETAAIFAGWLISAAGLEVPARRREARLDIRNAPLELSCQLFASHMVPALVDTALGMARFVRDRGAHA